MEVLLFEKAENYNEWVNHYLNYPIEIISMIVFDGVLIVTYKRT